MIFANLEPCAVSPDTGLAIQTPMQRQADVHKLIQDWFTSNPKGNLALSGGYHAGKTRILKAAFSNAPAPEGFQVLSFAKTSLKEWLSERQKITIGKEPESRVYLICADTLRSLHDHNTDIDRYGWASRKLVLGGKPVGSDSIGRIDWNTERRVARTKYVARFLIDELDTTALNTAWRRDEFEEFVLKCYEYRDCVQLFTAMNQSFQEWRESYAGDNSYWKFFSPRQTLCITMRSL